MDCVKAVSELTTEIENMDLENPSEKLDSSFNDFTTCDTDTSKFPSEIKETYTKIPPKTLFYTPNKKVCVISVFTFIVSYFKKTFNYEFLLTEKSFDVT